MPTVIIRPDAVITESGWANGAGAGTHQVRISDNTDTTSIRSDGNNDSLNGSFADIGATPATKYSRRVRLSARFNYTVLPDFGTPYEEVIGELFSGASLQWTPNNWIAFPTGTIVTYNGPWATNPDASVAPYAWADVDINRLQFYINTLVLNGFPAASRTDVYDVWVEVDQNSYPTVTAVTAPTGTITATSRPVITFTYTDADSDNMDQFRVKVFDSSVYGAGGFDPNTSVAAYDSGYISQTAATGTNVSHTPTADLPNGGTYKVYVMVRQVLDSVYATSWFASAAFTVSLDAPAQPTITAVADDANARITVTAQARDNLLTKNQASLETDTTGWAAGANTTISRITSDFLNGIASLQLASVAAGDMSATTPTGVAGVIVVPGATYTALASFKRKSATSRSCRVDIAWYTAAGALISTSLGTASNQGATFGQKTVTATAPGTAAFATVIVTVLATAAAAEQYAVDAIDIGPGTSTVWTRGGFVDVNQTIYIERSDDGGTTWSALRNGTKIDPDATQSYVVQDYEAVPGIVTNYRARVSGFDLFTLTGPYSASATATSQPTTTTGWWLIDPLDPTQNQQIDVSAASWDTQEDEEQAIYHPLGRKYPVIVSDVIHGRDGQLDTEFITLAGYNAFKAARNNSRVLLLKRLYAGLNEQKYIRLGKSLKISERNTNPVIYELSIAYVEVDKP